VLTHTLRRLQGSGLVARQTYAEAPPRVEYELTELGRTLIDPIGMLAQWAEANGDAILDAQDRVTGPVQIPAAIRPTRPPHLIRTIGDRIHGVAASDSRYVVGLELE
jgi:HxlR-like helix-turn-helix